MKNTKSDVEILREFVFKQNYMEFLKLKDIIPGFYFNTTFQTISYNKSNGDLFVIGWPKDIQNDNEKTFELVKNIYYQLRLEKLLYDEE